MKYLLDTHVALWVLQGEHISDNVLGILDDITSKFYLSLASAWEVAIKISIGKLEYIGGVKAFLDDIRAIGFRLLQIDEQCIELVEKLEFYHRDPFDRLLIASAIATNMPLLTADQHLSEYNVKCIW